MTIPKTYVTLQFCKMSALVLCEAVEKPRVKATRGAPSVTPAAVAASKIVCGVSDIVVVFGE